MQQFRDVSQRTWNSLEAGLPDLLIALSVLVGGWLVAWLIAFAVRWLLHRTTLDNKIAAWVSGDESEREIHTEKWIGRIVFWILMVVVLVAFFQVLGMPQITEPLNGFLTQIFEFLPRLLSAAALLALAWLIATGLRFAVERVVRATRLDSRLSSSVEKPRVDDPDRVDTPAATSAPTTPAAPAAPARREPTLARTLGETVYWLVFLLFLPAILDALALEGLLAPVNSLVGEILAFLPNLLAALLIGVVGWFVARIIRRIVTNLLAATGLDRMAASFGLERVFGNKRASEVIGLVVYVLVLLPVLISALNALDLEAVTAPASSMLDTVLAALPRLFAAAVLLVLAWVLAKIVSSLAVSLLAAIGFDRLFQRFGFTRAAASPAGEHRTPSQIAGTIVLVVVMLFATIEALRLLEFEALAAMVAAFTVFLGKVALAVAVFAIGLYLADLAARTIRASGVSQAQLLATGARVAVLVLATAMALRQLDVAEDIINAAFVLTLGAVAVAAAIAFGLGGRETAARYLERWDRRLSSPGPSTGGPTPGSAPGSPPPSGPTPGRI